MNLFNKHFFIHFIHSKATEQKTTMESKNQEIEIPYFWKQNHARWKHPFGMRVVGPTQVGKTHFVMNILQDCQQLIAPTPTKIYWAFGEKNETQMKTIQQMSPLPVHFIEGIPDVTEFTSDENNLLILDDLMADSANSKIVSNLFTRASHHRNMSVILMLQNLFPKGTALRDVGLNSMYDIIFANTHDMGQIKLIARKLFPENPAYFIDAFEQATSIPHGCLQVSYDPATPRDLRLSSGFFPPQIPMFYIPKKPLTTRK
jgi:hypothetical protein